MGVARTARARVLAYDATLWSRDPAPHRARQGRFGGPRRAATLRRPLVLVRVACGPERERQAPAAIRALGTVYLGSGREDVFADIRRLAEQYRCQPVRGKKHCKPRAKCA